MTTLDGPAASISVLSFISFNVVAKKRGLLGDPDPDLLAMPSDQQLDHVRHASMFPLGCLSQSFFQGRFDPQIQRRGLSSWHIHNSESIMYRVCNAIMSLPAL